MDFVFDRVVAITPGPDFIRLPATDPSNPSAIITYQYQVGFICTVGGTITVLTWTNETQVLPIVASNIPLGIRAQKVTAATATGIFLCLRNN